MLGHDNYHINTATGDNGHLAYLEAYQSYFISSVKRYDNIQLAYDYIQFIYAHTRSHTPTHTHTLHVHIHENENKRKSYLQCPIGVIALKWIR